MHQEFLLRVARHLVRDEHGARDLVQDVWVNALQHGGMKTAPRAFWCRVMRSLASNDRRAAARRRERESRVAAERPTEDELDARLESQEQLLAALRALPEPYRRTVYLRYSEGWSPTKIARRERVPVATVKARLARGLHTLRRGLGAGGEDQRAVGCSPLAAWVASHSRSDLLTTMGPLVMKKLMAGLAAVLALTFASVSVMRPAAPVPPIATPPATTAMVGSLDIGPAPATPVDSSRTEVPVQEEAIVSESVLVGRVLDAGTQEGLAGVLVELFAPRKVARGEWARVLPDVTRQGWGGMELERYSGLSLTQELTSEQEVGRQPIPIALPAEATPLASVRTDTLGRFTLPKAGLGADGGVLLAAREGYGTRRLAVLREAADLTVALSRPSRLSGRVFEDTGRPVQHSVSLRFVGREDATGEVRYTGYWDVRTAPDGAFACDLPSSYVSVQCNEPGWCLAWRGIHPDSGQPWAGFRTSFEPGHENEPVIVVVRRARGTVLRVVDDATGEPVREFRALVRETPGGRLLRCGNYQSDAGEFPLVEDLDGVDQHLENPSIAQRGTVTLWATHHVARTVAFVSPLEEREVEVRLPPGGPCELRGVFVASGSPVEGAEVLLLPQLESPQQRRLDPRVIDAARTDVDGTFRLCGPPGEFKLQVNHAGEYRVERVTLPFDRTLILDFDSACVLSLTLSHPDGAPCPDLPVMATDVLGERVHGRTDEDGIARLGPLAAGTVEVAVAYVPHPGSWRADEVRTVELSPRQAREERWTIPRSGAPVFPVLLVDGEAPAAGWHAVAPLSETWTPVAVGPDGTIPIDVQGGSTYVEIEGPDGRWWRRRIEEPPQGAVVIELSTTGAGYVGQLRDALSGAPLALGRVVASPMDGAQGCVVSVPTDGAGRFELLGLASTVYRLSFRTRAGTGVEGRADPLADVLFEPTSPAATPAVVLDLELPLRRQGSFPALEGTSLRGTVAGTRSAARIYLHALYPTTAGTLDLRCTTLEPDERGRYSVEVPRAPRYRAVVRDPASRRATELEVDAQALADGGPWDLVFPEHEH